MKRATTTKRAMVTATWVAGDEEGDGNGDNVGDGNGDNMGDGNGNKGGG